MMDRRIFQFNVRDICENYDFEVNGVSSLIHPKDNTIMFLTAKNLDEAVGIERCWHCLIFVPKGYNKYSGKNGHCIIETERPRERYAELVNMLVDEEEKYHMELYNKVDNSYISKNADIGKRTIIGPDCVIGQDVSIGNDCIIYSGVKIYGPTRIGNGVVIRDNTVIGTQGFGMFINQRGERERFPFLGEVIIRDNVEIGALCNIERAVADATIIDDRVKMASLTSVEHDVYIGQDSVIVSAKIAGFVELGKSCFVGLGSHIKQRIHVGDFVTIGAGAVVINNIPMQMTVAGVPAKII